MQAIFNSDMELACVLYCCEVGIRLVQSDGWEFSQFTHSLFVISKDDY